MLLLKLTVVPLAILIVSQATKLWGPTIGGLLTGLPIVAGPITFFLALEYGPDFALVSAHSTLLGVIALSVFCFVYSWCSTKLNWFLSLSVSWLVYFALSLVLSAITVGSHVALVLVFAFTFVVRSAMPQTKFASTEIVISTKQMAARVISSVTLVLIVTNLAVYLGPNLSGIYAAFPVAATVLAVFTHIYGSVNSSVLLLKGLLIGVLSLGCFYYSLTVSAHWLGFYYAFLLSIGIVVMLQFLSIKFVKKVNK